MNPKIEKADRKGKDQVTPVTVAKVIQKTVPVQVSALVPLHGNNL